MLLSWAPVVAEDTDPAASIPGARTPLAGVVAMSPKILGGKKGRK
jgi:hypothetical protein